MIKQLDVRSLGTVLVVGHCINMEGSSIMYYYLTPSPYLSTYVKVAVVENSILTHIGNLPLLLKTISHKEPLNLNKLEICKENYQHINLVKHIKYIIPRNTMLGLINHMENIDCRGGEYYKDEFAQFFNTLVKLELGTRDRRSSLRLAYFKYCEILFPPNQEIVVPSDCRILNVFGRDIGSRVYMLLDNCGGLVVGKELISSHLDIFGKIILGVVFGLCYDTVRKPIDQWITLDSIPLLEPDELTVASEMLDYLTNFIEHGLPKDYNSYVQFYRREPI